MINSNIEHLTKLFKSKFEGTNNNDNVNTEKNTVQYSIWNAYNNTDTEENKSVNVSEDNSDTKETKSTDTNINDSHLEEIYEAGAKYAQKVISNGKEKYAEIDKARKEPTSTGLTYDEAIKILDEIPRAGFGVIRDEQTGELRRPTVEEIYEFCKSNPDIPQSKDVMERIEKALQTKKEIETKYPEITSNEYNLYDLYNSNMNFGV